MPDSQYYFSGNYAQPDCEYDDANSFKSTVDEVFGETKQRIKTMLSEEGTKKKLIEQMKHLNEDENKKEKCPFLKIPVMKTENDKTLFSLIDENFRDIDRRCVFDLNYNDNGKTLTLKSDKYIEKKIEELKGYYRSLITTFYLKRVVDLNNREDVLKSKNDDNENNTKELVLKSINDRDIYYFQLPLELQEQARQNNKSLIIRDDVDMIKGYQQSRGFLQLGFFNKAKYDKEYKENKLLTYFKNYCVEQYHNYNLVDTMDDLTILTNLWMVEDDGIIREIEFGINTTNPAVNRLNIVHGNIENFMNPDGGKRKSRRRLNTKSTKKYRKSKKSRKSRKSKKSRKSRK